MKYVVKCRDYTHRGEKTREAAEQVKAGIERLGACPHEHTIEEVDDE